MPFEVAWRILTYQKGRTALATGGIFIAILLIFVELGFFIAVPQGGMLVYDQCGSTCWCAPTNTSSRRESGSSRAPGSRGAGERTWRRPARFISATPVAGPDRRPAARCSVIGIDPGRVSRSPTSTAKLRCSNAPTRCWSTARPLPVRAADAGRVVELDGRVTIGGPYVLGTGFLGLGVALATRQISSEFSRRPAARYGQSRPGHAETRHGPDKVAQGVARGSARRHAVFTRAGLPSTRWRIGRRAPAPG